MLVHPANHPLGKPRHASDQGLHAKVLVKHLLEDHRVLVDAAPVGHAAESEARRRLDGDRLLRGQRRRGAEQKAEHCAVQPHLRQRVHLDETHAVVDREGRDVPGLVDRVVPRPRRDLPPLFRRVDIRVRRVRVDDPEPEGVAGPILERPHEGQAQCQCRRTVPGALCVLRQRGVLRLAGAGAEKAADQGEAEARWRGEDDVVQRVRRARNVGRQGEARFHSVDGRLARHAVASVGRDDQGVDDDGDLEAVDTRLGLQRPQVPRQDGEAPEIDQRRLHGVLDLEGDGRGPQLPGPGQRDVRDVPFALVLVGEVRAEHDARERHGHRGVHAEVPAVVRDAVGAHVGELEAPRGLDLQDRVDADGLRCADVERHLVGGVLGEEVLQQRPSRHVQEPRVVHAPREQEPGNSHVFHIPVVEPRDDAEEVQRHVEFFNSAVHEVDRQSIADFGLDAVREVQAQLVPLLLVVIINLTHDIVGDGDRERGQVRRRRQRADEGEPERRDDKQLRRDVDGPRGGDLPRGQHWLRRLECDQRRVLPRLLHPIEGLDHSVDQHQRFEAFGARRRDVAPVVRRGQAGLALLLDPPPVRHRRGPGDHAVRAEAILDVRLGRCGELHHEDIQVQRVDRGVRRADGGRVGVEIR
mmetsp:Transcript_30333/g.91823  ORF Transcript_30333/g.91823 Transcript_30333/m.91823 type:complete len:639 (-) Transcript_30333:2237-4153(-)